MTTAGLPNRISFEKIQDSLKKLEFKKNRLNNRINGITGKLKSASKSERNKRTRTLIQVGGLVRLAGLLDICDIQDGDDLQTDISDRDKAATLLGILITCVENFRDELSHQHLEHFKAKGIRALKMSAYYNRS
jgi:hypothetical protein